MSDYNYLITFCIQEVDPYTGKTHHKRITKHSTTRYFENDVNTFAANLRTGQVLFALDLYEFSGDFREVSQEWRRLISDTSIPWSTKVYIVKLRFPDGTIKYVEV